MGEWNFNMADAPRGEFRQVTRKIGKNEVTMEEHVPVLIIAAGNDLAVTPSKWIEKEQRWNMFTKDVPPIAWQPWPTHPEASS